MSNTKEHITEYKVYVRILVLLLLLTTITVFVTRFDLKAWNVTIALIIACTKGTLVLLFFMHLKFESRLLKLLVSAVMLLFIMFIILTLFDYIFR